MAPSRSKPALPPSEGDRLETLISCLSSRFINLPARQVDGEIQDALRRLCEFLGVDLAVLWQWSVATPKIIAPTHVHYAQAGLQPRGPIREDHYPWTRKQMLAGRTIAISSLEELPEEAAVDRQSARLAGIKSSLCLPLSVGDEAPVGALAFNSLAAEREWSTLLVQRLQLVAQVFGNALARKRSDEALRASEERLSLAAECAGAGFWALEYDTRAFWATKEARRVFGYSPDEVISLDRFEASVHPDDWDLVRGAIDRSARKGETIDVEYRIRLPGDGSVRWIASRGRPQLGSGNEPKRLMGLSVDVTNRRRAEEALRAAEARLAAGTDLAGLAFYEVDFRERTMFIDDRLRDLCGIPPDREGGLQALEFWMEHLHPDDRERVMDQRAQLHDGRLEQLSVEYRYLHPIRDETWIHHVARVARRDDAGRTLKSFGVLRDIAERKQAEDELRGLSQRLIRAQEEERALIARELHDDVTQRLAVLAIEAGRAELAARSGPQEPALRSIREGLVRLSEDIHSLAYHLHPSILDELGLAEALRAECERIQRQGRLDLSLELDPPAAAVGRDVSLCLFRVAQEALNNVARHSGARSARVTLRTVDGGSLLAVRDDGVGFDPASPGKRRSLGLASMRERVRLVNGTLDIESAPDRGTAVIVWVPAEGGSQ